MSSIASRIRSFFDQEQAGNDYVSLENAETLAALSSRKDRVEGRL
jgi:hypothetical protein